MTTTSEKSWQAEVVEHDPEHYEAEVVYEFSDGKKFKSTDKTDHGFYSGT